MKKTNKGFTLVELIIVIAVIGVLAAILIPVFANVVNKANQKSAMSDARNAVTEYVAAVTTGEGTTMPDSVIFAEKGNKVYGFTYTRDNGVEAIDEQGRTIATDFATTVAEYEADLVADGTIKARAESEKVDMFNAAKNGGIKTGLRTSMALDNADAVLFVERTMLNNLGFNNMVITLSYVPAASLTENAAAVYDTTYSNCFSINGVAQDPSMTLANAIAATPADGTLRLYKDGTTSAYVPVMKNITIDANGHEIKFTSTASGGRGFRIGAANVTMTIKNAKVTGMSKFERAFQIDSGMPGCTINLENVEATSTMYCINVCSNCPDNVVNVTDSYIKGWCALQSWSSGTINVKNSVLYGLNNKGGSSWNTFATVVVEGDSTMATTEGADNVHINIEDSLVVAEQTTGNLQYAFGFNPNSQRSSITVKNSDIKNNFAEVNDDTESGLVYSFGATTNVFNADNCSYNAHAEINSLSVSLGYCDSVEIPE